MAETYPPVSFHFRVEFAGFPGEYQFQSVTGLNVELETEPIAEGGENRFKHEVPVRSKYPNLVLKRGLNVNSELIRWCRKALEDFDFEPTDLVVKLLNEKHEPLLTWNIVHAWPVKWNVSDLNAEESKIAVETLELSYNYFKLI